MKTQEEKMNAFAHECRQKGLSVTAQRLAIYRDISSTDAHPSAEEVYARLQPDFPTLSLATVYKTLETFEKYAFLSKTRATGERARYDANRTPHQHLICRECGRIEDVYDRRLENLSIEESPCRDFQIEDYRVDFYGLCGRCRKG